MAARLTVIISQSALRDSSTVDLEETLVAQLMMAPGLDATLIGPIESIRGDSTDFLCLSGFNHNFGFVSWLDAGTVAEHWRRLSLPGLVAGPGSSPSPGEPVQKPRVYHFQIDRRDAGASILPGLQQLQRDREVQTVGIGIGGLPKQTSNSVTPPTRAVKPEEPIVLPPATAGGQVPSPPGDDDDDWQHLDQLVDDFDTLDL